MNKERNAKKPKTFPLPTEFKFKIGDKVKIAISDEELDDCNKDFGVWLRENEYQGIIDDVVEDVKYPYYIEGHDFLESELTLIEKVEN